VMGPMASARAGSADLTVFFGELTMTYLISTSSREHPLRRRLPGPAARLGDRDVALQPR
jgi:hypothetical protein